MIELLQASSVIGALCYAFGWVLVTAFTFPFGLQPEDIGAGPEELLVRIAVPGLALLLLVGGFLMPTVAGGWLAGGRNGNLRTFHLIFGTSQVAFFLTCSASLFAIESYLLGELSWDVSDPLKLAGSLPATLVLAFIEGALVLRPVGYEAGGEFGPGLGDEVHVRSVLEAFFIWTIVTLSAAGATGLLLSNQVARGENARVIVLNAYRVAALIPDSAAARLVARLPEKPDGSPDEAIVLCGIRFGEAEGLIRVYDPDAAVVYSLPTDSTMLINGSRGGRPLGCGKQ